jgi:hypothetical protein
MKINREALLIEKMSKASLEKPKSLEHREAIKRGWIKRKKDMEERKNG